MNTRFFMTVFSIVFSLSAVYAGIVSADLHPLFSQPSASNSLFSIARCKFIPDGPKCEPPCNNELIGVPGKRGAPGSKGSQGKRGSQGIEGIKGPQGSRGSKGEHGEKGGKGIRGPEGKEGHKGDDGRRGDTGETGATGATAGAEAIGATGATGLGAIGATGATGAKGFTGSAGSSGIIGFGDFFAIMPSDNPNPILGGSPVELPLPFASPSPHIIRIDSSTFTLLPGTYYVSFQANVQGVEGGGQLVISLNGTELRDTTVGTNVFGTEIAGMSIISVAINSTLQIINPAGNGALLLTQNAGNSGASNPVSAHLVILRIQ